MPRARRIKTGTDDRPIDTPGEWMKERARLREENEKLWKAFGDLQFGPRGADGVRNAKLANPEAARANAAQQLKNSNYISQIDKFLKNLKK